MIEIYDFKVGQVWQRANQPPITLTRVSVHKVYTVLNGEEKGVFKEDIVANETWKELKKSSTKTLARHGSLDEYMDSLPAHEQQPVIDDTFNDDTPAQTFGDVAWDMGTDEKCEAIEVVVCPECEVNYPAKCDASYEIDKNGRCYGCQLGRSNAGKMRLIGIAGPARAGKDTLASYLLGNLSDDWTRSSFADPLKAMLSVIGVDCSDGAKAVIDDSYGATPRHMMQTLGTEWGRHMIDGDIWVKAFARLNAGKCVIVPDVRFENEADLVREHGVLIHLVGRGGIEGNHVSENAIEFKPGDIVIDNSRDLAWLHGQVDGNAVLGEFVSAE